MPDDDFERFQNKPATHPVQIAAVREVERHAALVKDLSALTGKLADLKEKLAAKNVECQALRARAEIDGYRHQMRIDDLEKQLAQREAAIVRLKQALAQLMADAQEYAARPEHPAAVVPSAPETAIVATDAAEVAELRGQLQSAREEYEKLRLAMDNSLALKAARSIGSLLGKGARQ